LINGAVPLGYWQGVVDLTGTDPTADRLRGAPPTLVKSSAATAEMLGASFRRALERCARGPTRFDLLRLIIDVLELLAGSSDPDDGRGRPDWLVRARRAMDREDNLRVGVARFVELAAVSPAHLSRSVRACYDTTPTALVTDLRLRHAGMLLATSSLSVTEIATRCGFSSLPYFSRCFQTTQGVSPREFRRRARESVLP
jgi:AraC-like DNA-binding protein